MKSSTSDGANAADGAVSSVGGGRDLSVTLGKMKISELTIDRYDEVVALMGRTPGISIREADSREATARYLARNPGFSFIAEEEELVGCHVRS